MKYIFDFDDVLFNTKKFKERIYTSVEKVGISREVEENYYQEFKKYAFSLKKFLSSLFAKEKKEQVSIDAIYEEIMFDCKSFLNEDLIKIVQSLGVGNSLIVTSGDEEFQMDKIKRAGVEPLFSQIVVVPGSKKEVIEKICSENKNEKIIFVDDKVKFFEDIDMSKCPNLETILYDAQGFEKLKKEITS
jgi:FMN phosphatase YigB (HAD superfamily)